MASRRGSITAAAAATAPCAACTASNSTSLPLVTTVSLGVHFVFTSLDPQDPHLIPFPFLPCLPFALAHGLPSPPPRAGLDDCCCCCCCCTRRAAAAGSAHATAEHALGILRVMMVLLILSLFNTTIAALPSDKLLLLLFHSLPAPAAARSGRLPGHHGPCPGLAGRALRYDMV